MWLGFALTEAVVFYGLVGGLLAYVLVSNTADARRNQPLIKVVPGLMIWTLIFFLITFFVLRRYAFGPIQKVIDDRRERIRQSLQEAEQRPREARRLLEEHRKLIAEARGEAEEILAEARRVADAQRERAHGGDRGRAPAPARGHQARSRPRRGAPRADPRRGRRADADRDRADDWQGRSTTRISGG